jgi:tetratricopeptide (TPR) repeat protein
VATSGAYWLATKHYLDARVDAAISTRLAMYESLTAGQNFNFSDDYEQAYLAFATAEGDPQFAKAPQSTKNLIRDGMLAAIASCERPVDRTGDLNEITKHLGVEMPETGWRQLQVGNFYLRTGNVKEAEQRFIRSRHLFESNNERRASGDALRGLAYAELARGNATTAREMFRQASLVNPLVFSDTSVLAELRGIRNDRYGQQLEAFYPGHFTKSLDELTAILSPAMKK